MALTPTTTTRYDFFIDISHLMVSAATTPSASASASMRGSAMSSVQDDTTNTDDRMLLCQNGGLVGETPVPGAYNSICMGLQERIVPLMKLDERQQRHRSDNHNNNHNNIGTAPPTTSSPCSSSASIIVQQQSGGSGQTGMSVWNSGLLLTRLLDVLVDEMETKKMDYCRPSLSASKSTTTAVSRSRGTVDADAATAACTTTTIHVPSSSTSILGGGSVDWCWTDQTVIELGCGTGLVSIATYKLGVKSVLATDGNPSVVQLAQRNIERNSHQNNNHNNNNNNGLVVPAPSSSLSSSTTTIQAVPLQWGLLNAMDYSDSASLVLGADLTYNAGSWRVLAETMVTVLQPNGYVIYMSLGHDGFNVNAELDGFISVARSVGLVLVPTLEGYNLTDLLQNLLSDTEKNIVASSGGAIVLVFQKKQLNRLK
jgi:SAM-dependent methyltransferase